MPKAKTKNSIMHSTSIDGEILMKTTSTEARAEIAKSDVTNLTEITTGKSIVIDPARDTKTGRANAIIEDVPGQEVQVKDTTGGSEIANVSDLLTGHEEMIASDVEIDTTVLNRGLK